MRARAATACSIKALGARTPARRWRRWSISSPAISPTRSLSMGAGFTELTLQGQDRVARLRPRAVRAGRCAAAGAARGRHAARGGSALRAALAAAAQSIAALAQAAGREAAEILDFQVALLEDDELLEPVFAAIDAGAAAEAAWRRLSTPQIADYKSAPDEYLARALRRPAAICAIACCGRCAAMATTSCRCRGGAIVCRRRSAAVALPRDRLVERWRLALLDGSPTSHVAMLARARGVPMVVQLGAVTPSAHGRRCSTATAACSSSIRPRHRSARSSGADEVHRKDSAAAPRDPARPRSRLARRADAAARSTSSACEELEHPDAAICDGIGLMRTEFLLGGERGLPDEERSIDVYDRMLRWAGERPRDDPHLRCRRRQADRRVHARRRGESVPRRARPPPVAAASGGLCACSCARSRAPRCSAI